MLTATARKTLDARHREWAASKAEGRTRESGFRYDDGLDDAPADPYVAKVLNSVNQLGALLSDLKADTVSVLGAAQSDATKAELRAQTDAAQRLGIYGAPSFTTADGELFWGNDRLERALSWAKHGR